MALYSIGWFSTGRDKAARDLLQAVQNSIDQGEIKARLSFVFSNREPGESRESDLFFNLVRSYHIPLVCFSYNKFRKAKGDVVSAPGEIFPQWRREYDREVIRQLGGLPADLGVLAGYMLIVGEEMCQRYNLINLHPALPGGPTGTWQEVIWKLIENDVQETGVMMHLVTSELDRGPAVTYCSFPIRGKPFDRYWQEIKGHSIEEIKRQQGEQNPLFQLIRQQGLAREFPLITATLKAFAEGKFSIKAGRVLNAQGIPIPNYDLSTEIEERIAERGIKGG